jgi:hypothetical protein
VEQVRCRECGSTDVETCNMGPYCAVCKSSDVMESYTGKRIYIAGPYCPVGGSLHDAARTANRNVQRAIEIFHKLKAMGYVPFVPHLSHYLHIEGGEDYGDFWLDFDLLIMERWAEAVFMMKGWHGSRGSRLEHKRARRLNLEIIYEEYLDSDPEASG